MKRLRTLSTRSLILLAVAVAALAGGGAAIAVASGGSGPKPAAKPLAQAIHDSLNGPEAKGITARIKFTNRLFPSGALVGNVGSALMSGASGRLWLTGDGRGRLELQSNAGDVQIVWNGDKVTLFDASSNSLYRAKIPSHGSGKPDAHSVPTMAEIGDFITKLSEHAHVSGAIPSNIANQPAYNVVVSPKHDGGLLGSVQLAWDAARGIPLRFAIYAQGASKPVLGIEATHISYGAVPASDVNISPPSGAKTVDLAAPSAADHSTTKEHHPDKAPAANLRTVRAGAGFAVVAPDTLVGLPRKDVRLVGPSDSQAALVVYGQGLGAIAVLERKGDAGGAQGALSSLPKISLDGLTAHELATQLGTVLEWKRSGVDYVLAGSLPAGAAETAARALK